MTKITREDPRYSVDKEGAFLCAWAGPDLTMPMGFWSDTNAADFEQAVRDELTYGLQLSAEEAAKVNVEINPVARED